MKKINRNFLIQIVNVICLIYIFKSDDLFEHKPISYLNWFISLVFAVLLVYSYSYDHQFMQKKDKSFSKIKLIIVFTLLLNLDVILGISKFIPLQFIINVLVVTLIIYLNEIYVGLKQAQQN